MDLAYLQAGLHVTHDAAVVYIQSAAVALEGARAQAVVARLRHLAPPKDVHRQVGGRPRLVLCPSRGSVLSRCGPVT